MRKPMVLLAVSLAVLPLATSCAAAAGEPDEPTVEQVRDAIEAYVRKDVELKEKFLLLDPRSGAPLALAFDHVHAGVHPHDRGYIACVDFTDASGTTHDVDVVVSLSGEAPEVREVFLHKVAGEPVKPPEP